MRCQSFWLVIKSGVEVEMNYRCRCPVHIHAVDGKPLEEFTSAFKVGLDGRKQ